MSDKYFGEIFARFVDRGDIYGLDDLRRLMILAAESEDPKAYTQGATICAAMSMGLCQGLNAESTMSGPTKEGKAVLDEAYCGEIGDSLAKNKGACTKDQHLKIVRMAGELGWDLELFQPRCSSSPIFGDWKAVVNGEVMMSWSVKDEPHTFGDPL